MRFEKGQQVVCINKDAWPYGFGPDYNEVVTIEDAQVFKVNPAGERVKNTFWLAFVEYKQRSEHGYRIGYAAKYFRPVTTISELTSILNEEPAFV